MLTITRKKEVFTMRFITTFFWAVGLSSVITYVLTSISREPFNFVHTLILAVIFFITITVLGEVILKEPKEQEHL